MEKINRASIYTRDGWIFGDISFQEKIIAIEGSPCGEPRLPGNDGRPIVIPGFIDCHIHGSEGHDIMQGGDAAKAISIYQARHGTTSFLATTMTAPKEDIIKAVEDLSRYTENRPESGSKILGVHLEGPFINRNSLGAQPDHVCQADVVFVEQLNRISPISAITIAPEIEGHIQFISDVARKGIRAQIGHSSATYEDCCEAMQAGATGFTHLFNGVTGFHHREPGVVGAALARGNFAEVIVDTFHVSEGAVRMAFRAIPGAYCVSDSTAAAGMPNGEYQLGCNTVYKHNGCVRLKSGSLAGSAINLYDSMRILRNYGYSIRQVSDRLSRFPAEYLGLTDRGVLSEGAFADLVLLNADLSIDKVFVEGVCASY